MEPRTISLPTLAMIAGTRGMLGAGLGLLLASQMSESRRRGVGRVLFAVGVLSTIPLLRLVLKGRPEGASVPTRATRPRGELRSGGTVDAPGKRHKPSTPSLRGTPHSDESIAKARKAEALRRRSRGESHS
jgi:hypothetical protein